MLQEPTEAKLSLILSEHYSDAVDLANQLLSDTPMDEKGCLTTSTQYPRKVRFRGLQMSAYRFIYCVNNRIALPFRVVIRHRCANRLCIHPAHLEQGDRRDNKHDDWAHRAYGINHAHLPRG